MKGKKTALVVVCGAKQSCAVCRQPVIGQWVPFPTLFLFLIQNTFLFTFESPTPRSIPHQLAMKAFSSLIAGALFVAALVAANEAPEKLQIGKAPVPTCLPTVLVPQAAGAMLPLFIRPIVHP